MATTETLNEGPDWCDVWNAPDLGWHIRCTQESLGPGDTRGGGTVDVDAFTFPGTRYFVMMYDGTNKWLDPGRAADAALSGRRPAVGGPPPAA